MGSARVRKESSRDEQGAVAPLVAVLVVLLVGLASFAVDLGYQRVAARDMQAIADIVALDMARDLRDRSTSELNGKDTWNAAVAASLARNDDQAVGDPLEVVTCEPEVTSVAKGHMCATPGVYDPADGTFVSSGHLPATHVRVMTHANVDYFFPVFAKSGSVTRTAYADAPESACIRVGSYAARLATGDSPLLGPLLGDLLGSHIDLGVLDWNGIAGVDVQLLDLIGVESGVGTVGSLIEGDGLISLRDFYVATLQAVEGGEGSLLGVGLLNKLISLSALDNFKIKLSDLIDVGNQGTAGLDASVNLLDLVTAAVQVADGESSVSIPALNVNLAPLATVSGSVKVTDAPKLGCKDGTATTSQISVDVDAVLADLDLSLGTLNLGGLGIVDLSLAKTKITADVDLDVAPASATITKTSCADPKSVTVATDTGLLTWTIGIGIEIKGLLGARLIDGNIIVTGSSQEAGEKTKIILNDADYDVPIELGNGSIGLPTIGVDLSDLHILALPIGKPLQWVLDRLLNRLVMPLLNVLDRHLLDPLLGFLGLQVSGAELYVLREPSCGVPGLRG